MDVTASGAYLGLGAGALALLVAFWLFSRVSGMAAGTDGMRDSAPALQDGALAFRRRGCRSLAVFAIALAAVIFFAGTLRREPGSTQPATALAFLVGALCSGLAGYL